MRGRPILGALAVTGLLLVSCGSEQDDPAATDAATTEATTGEAAPDPTVGDTLPEPSRPDDAGDDTGGDGADDRSAPTTSVPSVTTTPDTEPDETTATTGPDDDADGADRDDGFLDLVESKTVDVSIDVPEGGVSGELLLVSITNVGDDAVEFTVPCGLLFVPDGSDVQRMINLTPFDVQLDANETIEVTPYVMCVDSSAPGPDAGAAYVVGTFAGDDLVDLAECICRNDLLTELGPMGDMSLQMAMWAVSDGEFPDLDGALDEAQGALGEVVGGETGIDFDEIAELIDAQGIPGMEGFDVEAMLAQAATFLESYMADAEAWLDRCEINLSD